MSEQQRLFDGTLVDTRDHPEDLVERSDGTSMLRRNAIFDCRGNAYANMDDRHEADVEIVTEILENEDEWVTEYTTKNEDYPDMYCHIVEENPENWPPAVTDWLEEIGFDKFTDDIVKLICKDMQGASDCETIYEGSDFDAYYGSGCVLDSFAIGEYENQMDFSAYTELQTLHDQDRLNDILDNINCDVHVSRSKKRVRNEQTGYYEEVGRDTYNSHGSDYLNLLTYHMPGGRWHYVVSDSRMRELLAQAIVSFIRENHAKNN